MSDILDQMLAEVCLDERVPDGIFDMSNNAHMDALRETMVDKFSVSLNDARGVHNKMVEGKYPERQAYNKDGLLVTFPTPQYKAKAISRGTHFEQDPTKGAPNVFGGGEQQPAQGQPAQGQPSADPTTSPASEVPQQNIFPTGGEPKQSATPAATPPSQPAATPPSQPAATPPAQPAATPPAATQPSALPQTDTPDSVQHGGETLAVEPAQTSPSEPSTPPTSTPASKTPEQKTAEAQVVKQIMRGNNADLTTQPSINEQWKRVEQYCKQENLNEILETLKVLKSIN